MTYNCKYRSNPSFPYQHTIKKHTYNKKSQETFVSCNKSDEKEEKSKSFFDRVFFDKAFIKKLLSPVENFLGREVCFDDLLLVVLIYLLFTEKENEDKTLLICLFFILLD